MNSLQIQQAIMQLESKEDLDDIILVIKRKRQVMNEETKAAFNVGQKVAWTKGIEQYTGVILKINQKNIKVKATNGTNWNIHPSFLMGI